jgi:hypothetical protein
MFNEGRSIYDAYQPFAEVEAARVRAILARAENDAVEQKVELLAQRLRALLADAEARLHLLDGIEGDKLRRVRESLWFDYVRLRAEDAFVAELSQPGSDGRAAEVAFKLRAADPCNLLYVMWRLFPEEKIVVSVKRNPGRHTSRECGNAGSRNLNPQLGLPPPPPELGSSHVLSASIAGRTLRVMADGALAWEVISTTTPSHSVAPPGFAVTTVASTSPCARLQEAP